MSGLTIQSYTGSSCFLNKFIKKMLNIIYAICRDEDQNIFC